MKIQAVRYHDISCGHRVAGHEGHCKNLHGHNYRIHFFCEAKQLDSLGRVIDFGIIKDKLCTWLDCNWDHKFLMWIEDTVLKSMPSKLIKNLGVIWVPFNPTAENIAKYLLEVIGPKALHSTDCRLVKVIVEETRKCSGSAELQEVVRETRETGRLVGPVVYT